MEKPNSKTLEVFISNLADAIDGLDISTIDKDTVLQDIPQWDSLAILAIIAMADEAYKVAITGKEIQTCKTISGLMNLCHC